jgi:hypothetical protein
MCGPARSEPLASKGVLRFILFATRRSPTAEGRPSSSTAGPGVRAATGQVKSLAQLAGAVLQVNIDDRQVVGQGHQVILGGGPTADSGREHVRPGQEQMYGQVRAWEPTRELRGRGIAGFAGQGRRIEPASDQTANATPGPMAPGSHSGSSRNSPGNSSGGLCVRGESFVARRSGSGRNPPVSDPDPECISASASRPDGARPLRPAGIQGQR